MLGELRAKAALVEGLSRVQVHQKM